jgi:hypothetical protein
MSNHSNLRGTGMLPVHSPHALFFLRVQRRAYRNGCG